MEAAGRNLSTSGDETIPTPVSAIDAGTENSPNLWPRSFEEAIVSMLPDIEDAYRVTADTDLAALGLNSLGRTGLVILLQDEWDVEFPDDVLVGENFETPATLWAAVSPFAPADT